MRNESAVFKRLIVLAVFVLLVNACDRAGSPKEQRVASCPAPAGPVSEATGGTMPCEAPKRIVTLMPSLGELVHAIDGGAERIVGVSEFTDFPGVLKSKPSVGPYQNVNFERMRSLKPDLILASMDGNSKDQIERLRGWGYPVAVIRASNFGEIHAAIQIVAQLMRAPERGEKLSREFQAAEAEVLERVRKVKVPKSVLLQLGDEPLVAAGGKTYLDEAISKAGARNIYSDSTQAYPRISYEDVVKRNPDMILILSMNADGGSFDRMKERWTRFPKMKAAGPGGIRILRADALLRPGVRLMEGVKTLQAEIYPDLGKDMK